jgi:aspartyl-tRNA(Asn)/glutamyl-tRNA(Gln) amidotransferase subunit C
VLSCALSLFISRSARFQRPARLRSMPSVLRCSHEIPALFIQGPRPRIPRGPMKISRADVVRVAELAHLDLSPEEVELYRGQLDEILSYIGKLLELDVSHVEPMNQTIPRDLAAARPGASGSISQYASGEEGEPNLRPDVIEPCNIADEVLAHAPEAAKPFFRVPKVIER